jgi:hypothetical protein
MCTLPYKVSVSIPTVGAYWCRCVLHMHCITDYITTLPDMYSHMQLQETQAGSERCNTAPIASRVLDTSNAPRSRAPWVLKNQ